MKTTLICTGALLAASQVMADLATVWAPGAVYPSDVEGMNLDIKVLGTGTNSEGAAETTYEVKVEMVDGTELGGDGATYAQTVTMAEGASHFRLAQVQETVAADDAFGAIHQSVAAKQDCKGDAEGQVTCVEVVNMVISMSGPTSITSDNTYTATEEAGPLTTLSYDSNAQKGHKASGDDNEDSGAPGRGVVPELVLAGLTLGGAVLIWL